MDGLLPPLLARVTDGHTRAVQDHHLDLTRALRDDKEADIADLAVMTRHVGRDRVTTRSDV